MAEQTRTISVDDALTLMRERKWKLAIEMCDEILEQMPQNGTAICIREKARWHRGADPSECVANIERVLDFAPKSPLVRTYMAEILISDGQVDRAREVLTEALEVDPDNIPAFSELVEITKFKQETDLVRKVRARFDAGELEPGRARIAAFCLAKIYSDLNQPEPAMHYVTLANAAAERDFDPHLLYERQADLEKVAQTGLGPVPHFVRQDPKPIFIVGAPRSGTTLVETILSRHPDVHAGGELTYMTIIENLVNQWLTESRGIKAGPHSMIPHIPEAVWQQNAKRTVEYVRRDAGPDIGFYTDKMPDNARRLPLISRLFPEAKIIYVRRHPLDTALSCLFKHFSTLNWAFRQDWLGIYYRNLTDSVALSRTLIPNPVLDLSYDLLVAEPEEQTRRLAAFAGFEWSETFLNPEQSERSAVMTASRWQVRQPIYTSSSARWKAYAPYLGELIEAMGGMEWIEAQFEEGLAAGRS